MLIAEDLLLLVFDDEEGKPLAGVNNLEYSLAGALLIELAMLGRVDVTDESDDGKQGRLVLRDSSPTGNEALDIALETIAKVEGRKPKDAVSPLSDGGKLSGRLLAGLADRGVLRREQGKVLKLFPVTRWPAEDSRHEEATRAELERVLVHGAEPAERTGALISLLAGMGVTKRIVEGPDQKLIESRAKEIAEGNWASEAMRKAVEQVTAAVMIAVFVPAIVTTTTAT
ncbi:GOLPH3/VPS74 family protein [Prauserella cavernicola]|uniref:GPP34 family phosphoprotein n=1 Tax=Prauserella cavernicola TaxID=2800127 RepID=A0A934QQL9_9PSEU|nr:GPP34 family phosphoprotein [Prauserella cavernicola]MBK1786412.1 GPP34 family phosphoprotein [Prauserella cavernicola]